MLAVSQAYKTAIMGDCRSISTVVKVYFNGDTSTPTVFTDEDVVDINVLDEVSAESDGLLGSVSSNEISIVFTNDANRFIPTNQSSPFYNKLLPNVLVEVYFGVEVSPGSYEFVDAGKYRTGDWLVDNESMEASVICNDKLYALCKMDVPQIPVQANVQLKDMFVALFTALGLSTSDYIIDQTLTQYITFGWFPNGSVREALQKMADAGCSITINRHGIILVKSMLATSASVLTLTDDDNIADSSSPQRFSKVYSAVNVLCKLPYLKPVSKVLSLNGVLVSSGSNLFIRLRFNEGPVANLMQINLFGAVYTVITNITYGAWDISFNLYNISSNTETVNVEILGKLIAFTEVDNNLVNASMKAKVGDKCLTVDSDFIQDKTFANAYCTKLLSIASNPAAFVSVKVWSNPELELLDVVTINDPTNNLPNTPIILTRITHDYDGGLEGTLYGIKVEVL